MELWQVQSLYVNSFFKYSKTISVRIGGKDVDVHRYLLDKRFVNTSLDDLKAVFSKCKVKDDECWYIIYSSIYLDNNSVYNNLNSLHLLISLEEFVNLVR